MYGSLLIQRHSSCAPVSGSSQSQAACAGVEQELRRPQVECSLPSNMVPRGLKAQTEQGWLWCPSTVSNTASNEPGPGRVWCGSQVRQTVARKEFWCPGRRYMDRSSCLRETAMPGRREGDGCAIKKGPKGSINGANAKGP